MDETLAQSQHDTLDGVPAPAENPFLVGHREQIRHVLTAIDAGKLPHGLILSGPRGIGKATFAFHLARHLIANADSAGDTFVTPDETSGLFRQVASGAHPQILHLTRPANDKGTGFKTVLAVDEIRKIGEFLGMTAGDGGYRVVIVDPADDLRASSANALLKNLEEPPRRTVFLLISHSAGALLPTIRSRCQIIRFHPLSGPDIASALERLGHGGATDETLALAEMSGGSVRNAILLKEQGGMDIVAALDQAVGNPADATHQQKLAETVAGRDREALFAIFNNHALEVLATEAGKAAQSGNLDRANSLAEAWQEARIAISETETYNLDQKQHALSMIGRLSRNLNAAARRM